jgi:hypothetical protein
MLARLTERSDADTKPKTGRPPQAGTEHPAHRLAPRHQRKKEGNPFGSPHRNCEKLVTGWSSSRKNQSQLQQENLSTAENTKSAKQERLFAFSACFVVKSPGG